MSKTDRNEALASLARLLRETDGEDVVPPGAAEIRKAKRYLAGLGIEAEEFVVAYDGAAGAAQPHVPLVEGLLDRLVESASMDRGRIDVFESAPEEPDLDRRIREIVRGEVDRLKVGKPSRRGDKKT